MAKNGYVVFVVSCYVRGQRDRARPLSDLDGNGASLLHAVAEVAEHYVGLGIQTQGRFEQAYEVKSWSGRGGLLMLQVGAGPYGTEGDAVHVETRHRASYSDKHALLVDLWAALAVAPDAMYAVLVCERRGARHLKNVIESTFLAPVGRRFGLTFHVDAHVDLPAWQRFLTSAQAYSVTAVWRSSRLEDYQPDTKKMPELKFTATGGVAARQFDRVVGALRDKVGGRKPGALNLRDLSPRDSEGYQQQRIEVVVGDATTRRTVVIEREELPQWVYETQGARPSSLAAHAAVLGEHARELLVSDYGASLTDQWARSPWPRNAATRLGVMQGAPPSGPAGP